MKQSSNPPNSSAESLKCVTRTGAPPLAYSSRNNINRAIPSHSIQIHSIPSHCTALLVRLYYYLDIYV